MTPDPRPMPVMLYVKGKRFYCERCGAGIFHETANGNLECNACGALYTDDLPNKAGAPEPRKEELRTFVLIMAPDIYISSGEFASREDAEKYFGPLQKGWSLVEERGPIEFVSEKMARLEARVRTLESGIEQAVDKISGWDVSCSASEKRALLQHLQVLLPSDNKQGKCPI